MAEKTIPKEDLRVRRTRKAIQDAFIELTVEKGYDAITVQDIVDRAVINRSTFYRHYLDKDDLLSKYMDEVTGVTFQDDVQDTEGLPSGVVKLLNHIQTVSEFYRIMLSSNGHPLVSDRLRRKIESRMRLVVENGDAQGGNKLLVEMRLRYISGAGIGAILWWVENKIPCSSEQLAEWISQLSRATIGTSAVLPELPQKNS